MNLVPCNATNVPVRHACRPVVLVPVYCHPSVVPMTCVAPSSHCSGSGAYGDQDGAHTSPSGLNSFKYIEPYGTDWYDRNFQNLQPPDIFAFGTFRPQPARWKKDGSKACVQVKDVGETNFQRHDVYWRYNAPTKQFEVCYVDHVQQKFVKINPDLERQILHRCIVFVETGSEMKGRAGVSQRGSSPSITAIARKYTAE